VITIIFFKSAFFNALSYHHTFSSVQPNNYAVIFFPILILEQKNVILILPSIYFDVKIFTAVSNSFLLAFLFLFIYEAL
jgi:hypothetical protein